MQDQIQITNMTREDYEEVARIYREGIQTGMATFEKAVPDWESWNRNHIQSCRLVARINGKVSGWAGLSPVSSRCVYGGVAEVSVYVETGSRRSGLGEQLLRKLISESEKNGYWTLQSGIFPENNASLRLHEKVGFRVIGYRERIGQLDGIWKDNILLERRSKKVG